MRQGCTYYFECYRSYTECSTDEEYDQIYRPQCFDPEQVS